MSTTPRRRSHSQGATAPSSPPPAEAQEQPHTLADCLAGLEAANREGCNYAAAAAVKSADRRRKPCPSGSKGNAPSANDLQAHQGALLTAAGAWMAPL